MRTKPVWKRGRVVWKLLPETKREWYRINGKIHIAIAFRDKVLDDLWLKNNFRKFRPPSKRTNWPESVWL